jgi:alpha-L-fucosidase
LTLDFPNGISFNRLLLQEFISLGQRVKHFKVEVKTGEGYKEIANETTIGYKRILRLPNTNTSRIKITILDAKDIPLISNIGVYMTENEPE